MMVTNSEKILVLFLKNLSSDLLSITSKLFNCFVKEKCAYQVYEKCQLYVQFIRMRVSHIFVRVASHQPPKGH